MHRFGENKVQEIRDKAEPLADCGIDWVMIGHLQTNKANLVAQLASEVQSLDRPKLAAALDRRLRLANRVIDVLIQVKTSDEPSQSAAPGQLVPFLDELRDHPTLRVRGLMTMAIHTKEPDLVRGCFRRLRELRDHAAAAGHDLPELSMGMSGISRSPWPRAAQVRIGTAIFGPPPLPGFLLLARGRRCRRLDLPVFADVDTGVDDAMALVYLLASAHVELMGIASTSGNVAVDQVCRNNLGLLHLCKAADIPVSKGADEPLCGRWPHHSKFHGPNGLGYAELPRTDRRLTGYDATAAWIAAAHAHPGELVGLVTGPLTNLALRVARRAGAADPAAPAGDHGWRSFGDTNPMAEWNIRVDPEAAAEVFAGWAGQQRLPIVCGLDLTRRVAMTPEILAGFGRFLGPVPVDRRDRGRDAVLLRIP